MFNRAEITKSPSTSNAALNTRMTCVLGSTNRHIITQNATISDKRKTSIRALINIHILYPSLTCFVKPICPNLPPQPVLKHARGGRKATKPIPGPPTSLTLPINRLFSAKMAIFRVSLLRSPKYVESFCKKVFLGILGIKLKEFKGIRRIG
jgi:hypothetical protein